MTRIFAGGTCSMHKVAGHIAVPDLAGARPGPDARAVRRGAPNPARAT
jgi:hypothetical protein